MRIFWILLFLIIFVPSENLLLSILPVSQQAYAFSRFGHEILIYLTLLAIIFAHFKNAKFQRLQGTPIDKPLLFFLGLTVVSIIINGTPLLDSLVNVRALIRYIFLVYIVVQIKPTPKDAALALNLMLIVGAVNSVIGIYQHYFGIGNIWIPRDPNLEIGGVKSAGFVWDYAISFGGRELGAAIGATGDTIFLALMLMVFTCLIFGQIYGNFTHSPNMRFLLWSLAILFTVCILFTYSRAAFLATLFALGFIWVIAKRWNSLVLAASFIILFVVGTKIYSGATKQYQFENTVMASPMQNVSSMFTTDYFEQSKHVRPWFIKEVGGNLLRTFNLIGYGPSEEFAQEKIYEAYGRASSIEKLGWYILFEDVYWIAMLAYYGIVGVGVFIYLLGRLWICAIRVYRYSPHPIYRSLGLGMMSLLATTVLMTGIVRTFEFRIFGFMFWLVAGLVIAEYIRMRKELPEAHQPLRRRNLIPPDEGPSGQ